MPRVRHYWRRRLTAASPAFAIPACDAGATIARLSGSPQPSLSWLDRFLAVFTTPFKRLGVQGWKETGCVARGAGAPVREAQHSTDGFWTIDVALTFFSVESRTADLNAARFLRLEVEPGTEAHRICSRNQIHETSSLAFGGPIVIDTDANFLECHPDEDFRLGT